MSLANSTTAPTRDLKAKSWEFDPRRALEFGKAAEHLVVADLLLAGYRAFLTDQGAPYDVVIDDGSRLYRVQVKSAAFASNKNVRSTAERLCYTWLLAYRGKDKNGPPLSKEHCDIVAAVALDIRAIAYFPIEQCGRTLQLSPPGVPLTTKFTTVRQWNLSVEHYGVEHALSNDGAFYAGARRKYTHCLRGHAMTPENTRSATGSVHICRECERRKARLYQQCKRAARREAMGVFS